MVEDNRSLVNFNERGTLIKLGCNNIRDDNLFVYYFIFQPTLAIFLLT